MQPIVGIIADRSTSKWGRRRPFLVVGTLLVCLSLYVLGWTKEIVSLFVSDGEEKANVTVALAVLAIYGVDFAINAIMSASRSLIVDTLPIPKQQLGSAWASRMVALGHLIGYGFGALDLASIFGTTLGDTQFKQLVVVSGFTLALTVGITCLAVTERVLITNGKDEDKGNTGAVAMFTHIMHTALNLPENIAAICRVQFWCWIGWFPFLFYSTTWYDILPSVQGMHPNSPQDRRSISSLQRLARCSRAPRFAGASGQNRQHGSHRLFNSHLCRLSDTSMGYRNSRRRV
jgi:solute carrier family 45 protein 1/2/4